MASGKGILLNAFARLLTRDTTISAVETLSDHFRSITLSGASLRSASWTPGDKIQVLLPTLDVRTYTPVRWSTSDGTTELLVYHHGQSPGAAWSRTAQVGDVCRFIGPQGSLKAPAGRPVVLFGDETSFAVARALSASCQVSPIFEVESKAEATTVLGGLGLTTAQTIPRSDGDSHLEEVARAIRSSLGTTGALLLTGRAQSIQSLRKSLKALSAPRPVANKAYWSVGKVGLD